MPQFVLFFTDERHRHFHFPTFVYYHPGMCAFPFRFRSYVALISNSFFGSMYSQHQKCLLNDDGPQTHTRIRRWYFYTLVNGYVVVLASLSPLPDNTNKLKYIWAFSPWRWKWILSAMKKIIPHLMFVRWMRIVDGERGKVNPSVKGEDNWVFWELILRLWDFKEWR